MSAFLDALRSGCVLLMDGAMGTEVARLLRSPRAECAEAYNLDNPQLIQSIHQAYRDAGADVLLTNTFQANPAALARLGLEKRQREIWHAAIGLARSVKPHFVLADIGPIDHCTWDVAADLMEDCQEADAIFLETWSSIDDFQRFADQCTTGSLPLLISFTYHRTSDLTTLIGATPEECASMAATFGAAAVGANCGKEIGMRDMVEIVKRYHESCELPVFIRPNAGTPSKAGFDYPRTPAAMAAALLPILENEVAMIGGCCGTTPEHIRSFREVLEALKNGGRKPP